MMQQADSGRFCFQCKEVLTADDKGIYMKMVSRNVREFLCMDCLSQKLNCTRRDLEERVRYYREAGNCVLFR